MSERLNASDYRLPVLDVTMAIALATALLSAAPAKPADNVDEALDVVRAALSVLEQKRGDRRATPAAATVDPRPIDNQVDTVWDAFHGALAALAALPTDLYPRAAEASSLLHAIFGAERPLAFLRLRYPAEWSEVKAHLDLIEAQKLEPRIQKLLGPEFMAEIRRTFDLYGAALGITSTVATSPSPDSLLEPLRSLVGALNDYVIAALSMVRPSKPGSRDVVVAALEPIDRLRRTRATPPLPEGPVQPDQGEQQKPESLVTARTGRGVGERPARG